MLPHPWPCGYLYCGPAHRDPQQHSLVVSVHRACAGSSKKDSSPGSYVAVISQEGLSVNAILYLFIYSSFSFVSATPWALPVRQAGGGVPRFPVLSTSAPSLGCAWMDTCATHAATAVDDTQASKAKERQAAVTCCFGERERQRERRGWCSMPWVLSQCASETHFQQARRPPTEKVPTEPGLGLSAWKHVLAGWKAN